MIDSTSMPFIKITRVRVYGSTCFLSYGSGSSSAQSRNCSSTAMPVSSKGLNAMGPPRVARRPRARSGRPSTRRGGRRTGIVVTVLTTSRQRLHTPQSSGTCRPRLVSDAAACAPLLLELGLEDMAAPVHQLLTHEGLTTPHDVVVQLVELLHDLERPAPVEHVAPYDVAAHRI